MDLNDVTYNDSFADNIFKHSQDAILLTVTDGRILAANPAACRLLERSENEICRLGRNGIVDLSDTSLSKAIRKREETGVFTGELRFLKADGTSFPTEITSSVYYHSPQETRTVLIIRDISQRKKKEEEHRHQEEILRLLVENTPAAIAMFDTQMRYLAVSKRYYQDYGIRDENILGKSHYDVLPDIPERWRAIHRRCLQGMQEMSEADPFPRSDGSLDWVRWSILPWYTVEREIGGVILFSEVITDRVRVANELSESEQRWKFALEGAGDGVWDWNLTAGHVFYSKQLKAMLGYDESEPANNVEFWQTKVHPEDWPQVETEIQKIQNGESKEYRCEYRLKHKVGYYMWILGRGLVVSMHPNGKAQRIIGTHTDISPIKKSEEKYRTLFETASEGILLTDYETKKISFVNPAMCALLGYEERELLGLANSSIHPLDFQASLPHLLKQETSKKFQTAGDVPFLRKDGTVFFADVHATLSLMEDREVVVGFVTDITEKKYAEAERRIAESKILEATVRMIEVVSKTIELRDPYTAGHQGRVTQLADTIALAMSCNADQCQTIHLASIVHDLGKTFIPSEILNKPGKLHFLEYELIKTHSQAGYDVLKDVVFPWPIAEVVYQHHERIDGSGYPRGLNEEQISLEAKIIAVADVVEAMASHRPYRAALGEKAALEEIRRQKGVLYDNEVVETCCRLFQRGFRFE